MHTAAKSAYILWSGLKAIMSDQVYVLKTDVNAIYDFNLEKILSALLN